MSTLIITYDLKKIGQNYTNLIQAIEKNYPKFTHPMQSVFFIKTAQTPKTVYTALSKHIDGNDTLFVGSISSWWANLPDTIARFLKS